jgi:branched-chain amino acid transport system substrate-binding protein
MFKKRILPFVLLAALAVSMAACGQKPPADEPAAEAPPSSEEAADAAATETLKIGLLVHQTDWFAGVDMPNFYEFNAMVAYVNEELGGWKIGDTTYILEAVNMDGRSDPEALRAGAIALVDAGVKFVVETNDFWVVANASVFEEADVLHSSAYCVYVPGYLGKENPMAFTASNGSVGDYAAAFEVFNKVYPDVKSVIFVNDDNGVNEGLFELMEGYGAQYGIDVLEDYLMYAGDTTDYSAVALQIVNSDADAFLGNGSPEAFGALLKEVRALGSDAVMACVQGKPATMLMEYAPAEALYNGFTLGASTRASDLGMNPELLNNVVEKVRELYGDEVAATFDGAACNNLYVMLQCMQIANSTDSKEVAKAWENLTTIDTLYGTGTAGGLETYGIANHAIGHPKPVSLIDPEAEDGWKFWGWIDVTIP